ncbi:hypothetical protein EON65_10880, partial [archaeon]
SQKSGKRFSFTKHSHWITAIEYYKDAYLPAFRLGIQHLAGQYHHMRQVRGDGNCFYRALWFGYLEILLKAHHNAKDAAEKAIAESELQRLIRKVKGSLQELVALGYSEFAIECFYEVNSLCCFLPLFELWDSMKYLLQCIMSIVTFG